MWVTRKDGWHKDMTSAEKFLAERIIQRCDYDESVSKKHRTINGYIQLKELVQLCDLSFKRIRTARTLASILTEAKSDLVKQNICQDRIVNIYFSDLKKFIIEYDVSKINGTTSNDLTAILTLSHSLKIFEVQLEKYYYSSLIKELKSIDYSDSDKTHRTLKEVSTFVDLLVSQLLYRGYAISSVNEVLRRWVEKKYRITISRVISFFNFHVENYQFLIRIGENTPDTADFISLIKKTKKIKLLTAHQIQEFLPFQNHFKRDDIVLQYEARTTDPNLHIRSQYDSLLKKLVVGKDRQTLSPFTHYFKDNFWKRLTNHHKKYNSASINGDPISVPSRKNTLRTSLILNSTLKFTNSSEIDFPKNVVLQKSIYYYNLALGSKSLENSLSLLWTSLETILPYRIYNSDIECIKHILGKTLSIGSISRDLYALIERINSLNHQNNRCFDHFGIQEFGSQTRFDGLLNWYNWLTDSKKQKEIFEAFKDCSELLAYEYSSFAKPICEGK